MRHGNAVSVTHTLGSTSGVAERLRAMGHQVEHRVLSYDPAMARAQAIVIDGETVRGGSDPRGGGGVAYM